MTDDPQLLLADTMAVTWYVLAPDRLPDTTTKAFEAEAAANRHIGVSAHSIVELVYMCENGKITDDELSAVLEEIEDEAGPFVVIPVDFEVAKLLRQVPRRFKDADDKIVTNADPGDRIIAATGIKHGLAVVTSDPKIHRLSEVLDELAVVWDTPEAET